MGLTDAELTPVLVTTGQAVERQATVYPVELAQRACEVALSATPGLRDRIDRVSAVNILTGGGAAPAGVLARRLGLHPRVTEVSTVGGNSPQWLLNRAASAIASGESQAVLIAGAEAQRSKRLALSQRSSAPSSTGGDGARSQDSDLPPDIVVGDERPGAGPAELAAGLIAPVHLYALFESAIAHRAGRSFEKQRIALGELMSPFTEVAAKHPFAWFAQVQSPSELSTIDADNRLVSEPYPKKMCAFMQVDQAAAVVITSLAAARAAGVADRAVFCWSGADVNDVWFPAARPDPGSSPGISAAASAALAASNSDIDDLAAIDLYSCFPCVVEMAIEALGLAATDSRGLTVTGGLAYFGGPGNNYTLHAIATMADVLRERGGIGLVSGLGWYATKHSMGIYGSEPTAQGWRMAETKDAQDAIDGTAVEVLDPADLESEISQHGKLLARVVAATVSAGRGGEITSAPVIARLEGTDARHIALAAADDQIGSLAGRNLVGEPIEVSGTPPRYRVAG